MALNEARHILPHHRSTSTTTPPRTAIVGPRLFTLGYQERSLEEYLWELSSAGVEMLVDIRETAWSRKPGFSKTQLKARLAIAGIEYQHARFAGNPKNIRRAAATHDDCLSGYAAYLGNNSAVLDQLDGLIWPALRDGLHVGILCYERHPNDCHRSILLTAWKQVYQRLVSITHLGSEGSTRLTQV
jgi:uncharacterized protein (DUF488 family)